MRLAQLDLGPLQSIGVEIEYCYTPADPQIRYYPDGSGHPGYAADADLLGVRVVTWTVDGEVRKRCNHWVWDLLDGYAFVVISQTWDYWAQQCVRAAQLQEIERN